MAQRLWNFVKRHRRKFLVVGAVVGGGVMLWKYAESKLKEFQEKEAAECLAHARKQHHFDSNQRTCNMTVLSMLPKLRETLMQALDSETLTTQLKTKPTNKVEIWEELKTLSFTRTIVAVYECAMLVMVLRVQLNIIGGYMYLDNMHGRNGTSKELAIATQAVQQKYLEAVQFLFGQGLQELIKDVQASVKKRLSRIPLKQTLSLLDIQEIFHDVRRDVEHDEDLTHLSLLKYILPECDTEEAGAMSREEAILAKLMNETRDMVSSEDFHHVLRKCFDASFSKLVDKIAEYFQPEMKPGHNLVNPNDISMALAKLIPVVNGLIHSICGEPPNPFIQELILLEPVKDFAANVYEAFSQMEEDNEEADDT